MESICGYEKCPEGTKEWKIYKQKECHFLNSKNYKKLTNKKK